jgi:hypothetical protein
VAELARAGRLAADAEVVLFNTGSGASYRREREDLPREALA